MGQKFGMSPEGEHASAGLGDASSVQAVPLLQHILLVVEDIRRQLSGLKKDFFTVEEVARSVGRSDYTVRRWIAEGRLEAVRVSGTGPRGKLLVPRDQFERIVATGGGGTVPAALVDDFCGSHGEIDRPRGGHDRRHESPQSGEPSVLTRGASKLARSRSEDDHGQASP